MRGWLRTYPVMTQRQRGYAELEASCAQIREYSPVIVPGLLQTPAYARVRINSARPLMADPDEPVREDTENPEIEVRARQARQELLTRAVEPPTYSAVLEETALSGRAGPPDVLRAQLAQLRKLAALSNVTLQVLPRDTPIASWYLPHTAFSLYRFADPQDPETLSIEGITTNLVVSDQDEISRYLAVFDWLQSAALTPEDTISWLTETARRISGGSAGPPPTLGSAMPPLQRSRRARRLTEQ